MSIETESNLIVNYLPNSMTDEFLSQMFSKFGVLENVKIVREKGTRKSMGYGFVKFQNATDAARAVAGMNGTKIENKQLKVAHARPAGAGPKHTNLYVAGLEPHVTTEELQALFQAYGKVTESKVLTADPTTKQSRCVGFVRFDTQEEADAAIAGLNGVTLPGSTKPLVVRTAEERDRRPMMAAGGMMGGRGGNMRYNPMGMYAGNMGNVGYQYPPAAYGQSYAAATQYPAAQYGAAAPNMFSQQPASAAVQRDLSNTFCLFVYNLPPETDEGYMYQLFGPYGAVANVKVMRDLTTNLCKGFGFINMTKLEDAQTAIAALNGAQIGTKTLQVSFKQQKGPGQQMMM